MQKALNDFGGKVCDALQVKNGTLLLEVHSDIQAGVLMEASLLRSWPFQVERHVFNSLCAVLNTGLDIMEYACLLPSIRI
jgi:hypothetical protein